MSFLICAVTNAGYLPYIENLHRTCNFAWKLNVVCMDQASIDFCIQKKIEYIPCILDGTSEFTTWSTNEDEFQKWNAVTFQKLDCLLYVLEMRPDVQYLVYIDGDIIVFKDFIPKLLEYRKYDLVIQCDEDASECTRKSCVNMCTGFMMLRNNSIIRDLLHYRKYASDIRQWRSDQHYINTACHTLFKKRLKYITLPKQEFPNGIFRNNIPSTAYLLHYNFLPGHEKQEAMRKNGHWSNRV